MKKILIKIMFVAAIALFGYSCDTDNLMELDNPKYILTPANADMSMMFTNMLREHGRGATGANALRLEGVYLKYYASYANLAAAGGYNQFDQGMNDGPWGAYANSVSMAVTLEDYLVKRAEPLMVNNLAFTRIMKVAMFQRLTDYYGDIPLHDAGLLALSGTEIDKPKYDTQQDVYNYMLETLKTEAANLTSDGAVTVVTWKEMAFDGDSAKWSKFAYSLMLRLAMRISDVDPAKAREYAELAISKGVITANADNYVMKTGTSASPDERNSYSRWFMGPGDPERYFKLGEYFVNHLKTMVDPRRKIIFGGLLKSGIESVSSSYMSDYWMDESKWDWDLTKATGAPHGINANPFAEIYMWHQAYTSPNPYLYIDTRPMELLTASEMLLLISEAAQNGWSTGTYTAESAYEDGVKANMSLLSGYNVRGQSISDPEMADYLTAHPLGTGDAAKQRIAEEMWVTMYMNPSEGWSNVRRMNLNLPDNSLNKNMPVRNAYPENEHANNLDNLNAALQRLGWGAGITRENEVLQRVWWDTKDNF